jgi:transcriptional regulator with XRE-family HTH domain
MRPSSPTAAVRDPDVGARIAERRRDLDLSQRQLAARVGVGAASVQGWERGRLGITAVNLERLARELDVEEGWLLHGNDRLDLAQIDEVHTYTQRELLTAIATLLPRLDAKLDALLRAFGADPAAIEDEATAAADGAASPDIAAAVARLRAAAAGTIELLAEPTVPEAKPPTRSEAPARARGRSRRRAG